MATKTPALWTSTEIMRGSRLITDIRKPWAAPKLTENGREFAPWGHENGATMHISLAGLVIAVQVWSPGPENGTVWAVDEHQGVHLVCVRTSRCGHSCSYRRHRATGDQLVAA